jgi:hypothetical protein
MVSASPAPMRAAAVRRATAVRRPTAVRGAHREMWCSAMRTAAVKCRAAVERGRASAKRRSAMGCGRDMEPRTTTERRPAMKARRAMERRFPAGCSSTSMDRSHRAETPGSAAGGPAPGRAGASRRRHGRSPGCIEAPPRSRIGIADAAAIGRIMHPYIARERGVAAGSERETGRIDGDVATPPIDPAPAP